MYGKLFTQMYDGTLGTAGPWQALVTFQQMIILADKEGTVDMTTDAISRRTTIPLDIIQIGITALEQPDPHSRTPDEEGRRIVRLSHDRHWGWRIVNYPHYRNIRSAEDRREYMRLYQRKRRSLVAPVNSVVNNVSNINQSNAYTSTSLSVDIITTLPAGLSKETWEAFRDARKSAKAKMTPHAEKLLLAKLERMAGEGQNLDDVVNQSIERGWKGLFPVSDDKQKHGQPKGKIQRAIEACDKAFGPLNNRKEIA